MKPEDLQRLLDIALGALADIAISEDLTLQGAKRKAQRIYDEIRAEYKE